MKRRQFLQQLSLGILGSGAWQASNAAYVSTTLGLLLNAENSCIPTGTGSSGRVLVVGGGMGGTTAAKYLKFWGGDSLSVALIEPNPQYYSNILSNQVVEGSRTLGSLAYDYQMLTQRYGVERIQAYVDTIDPLNQRVSLSNGNTLDYDKLVLSPGIDFLPIAGLDSNVIPHAWQAGSQTELLASQLAALEQGKDVILTIPPMPFRCPPGPYERACVFAEHIQRHNLGGKIIVLDANPGIAAGAANFSHAFQTLYGNTIDYRPSVSLLAVDTPSKTLTTSDGAISGAVLNVIPPQRAAQMLIDNNLANVDGRWAGVNMQTYESTAYGNVYVIGDAAHTTQPKAGHIANAEAKVCADAVIRSLNGEAPYPTPITNSSCYTPITPDTAAWLSIVYRYDPVTDTMKPAGAGGAASDGYSRENYREMLQWFENLMTDTFA